MINFARQSFLGSDAQKILKNTTVGLIGYSGGGCHLGEQLSRIGIGNFIVVDTKCIKDIHLPRFLGSNDDDVISKLSKTDIAERQIKLGNKSANVRKINKLWQEANKELLECDIIFGAVDSYKTRDELEKFCRRNLIPYIDIGMDVRESKKNVMQYLISGQIIQSLPEGHCMWCCGFLNYEIIKSEQNNYGVAGPAAQVIWANGVLASTAVSWGIELLCPWYESNKLFRYHCYNGNTGELKETTKMNEILNSGHCPHHPTNELGDFQCDIRDLKLK